MAAVAAVEPACEPFPWADMLAPMTLENMVSDVVDAVMSREVPSVPQQEESEQQQQPDSPIAVVPRTKLVSSDIYCQGSILHTVQMKEVFSDSKTFVDMKLKISAESAIESFKELMNKTDNDPTVSEVLAYVNGSFEEGDELDDWTPDDWREYPKALSTIRDPTYREWAFELNSLWKELGRKVKDDVLENPDLYSMVYVPNGFVIPGGRFKELYYWDTYWIIQGLLVCDMTETVKGVIGNMLYLVKKFGFVPNGSRVYYEERSQPPLLSAMMHTYYEKTKDLEFLEESYDTLEKEFQFWMNNSLIDVELDGKVYQLARYYSPSNGPRPESYREDYETTQNITDHEQRNKLYWELKSGAESGWDFSSRWYIDQNGSNTGNLTNIRTSMIVPVDLNSFLYGAARSMQFFSSLMSGQKYTTAAEYYGKVADTLLEAVTAVLWNETDGIWYDYDLLNKKQRVYFFGSNTAPLWTLCYNTDKREEIATKVITYIKNSGILSYSGGTPASLNYTGEQWDFPNCWAPVQAFLIQGLDKTNQTDAQTLAAEFAQRWLYANYVGYNKTGMMFEKYDAVSVGSFGGGGEYEVQKGFGWTNGFAFELLNQYYASNSSNTTANSLAPTPGAMPVTVTLLPTLVVYGVARQWQW